ncbi:UCH domain-containing protein [Cephalotus follicularis]|uniref:UCH domain-containing protein n=1 Tax=Cephalotus follicularis TaxID=3775 RepID=A0A1Q3CNW5_CEPFO|nr:UCH domain-containing protein [Cephalotus follicularis]
MNYVLQCLILTKPFMYEIQDSHHIMPCDAHTIGFYIICALHSLFISMVNYTSQALYVYKFVHHTSLFSSSFTIFKQEDAHEFLLGVLNPLEMKFDDSSLLSIYKPGHVLNLAKAFFLCHTSSTISCSNCPYTSVQSEPCYGPSLGYTEEMSLFSALSFYTSTKEISDMSCNGCELKVTTKKRVVFEEGVSFLILQLNSSLCPKVNIKGHIDFPLSLVMAQYSFATESLDYDFYGFIVHVGEFASSGHYYAFIFESSSLYKLNNEDIDPVDEHEVLKQEAYILFYKRPAINMNAHPINFDPMSDESSEEQCPIPKGMIHHF